MQQIADWLEKLGMSEYAQRLPAVSSRVGVAANRSFALKRVPALSIRRQVCGR